MTRREIGGCQRFIVNADVFEPGAGGSYKQLRGFDATPTWSVHHLEDPRLREGVRRFLEAERAEAAEVLGWYAAHTAHRRDAAAPATAVEALEVERAGALDAEEADGGGGPA